MPTKLDRVQVTVGDVVGRSLELAERRWPGLSKSEQLTKMLAEANDVEEAALAERLAARRAAIRRARGTVDYPPGYLEELRKEWPE